MVGLDDDRKLRDVIISTQSDVRHIRELLDDFKDTFATQITDVRDKVRDHENRLRCLETDRNQLIGKGAAIGFIVLVLLQLLSIIRGGG